MVMEESNKKRRSKSIITNLFNLQLGIKADQASFSYHTTFNSLMNLKPTIGLPNDPTIGNNRISEIQFNKKGNLLANSFWIEDDIQIWDWYKGTLNKKFSAGHNFTVSHCNWVPCDDENLFVTSGQQGDIRLTYIETNISRLLLEAYSIDEESFGMPKGYRFSVNQNLPYSILAGGHTGKIVHIDVRDNNPTELFDLKYDDTDFYEIHSLDINPVKCYEFCVGGINNVRVYDHRNSSEPIQDYPIPQREQDSYSPTMYDDKCINKLKYNFDGTGILAACNSDPIYLFDTLNRNAPKKFTIVRQPNYSYNIHDAHFYGQRSEFVMTISTIRQEFHRFHKLYVWDIETQELVRKVLLKEDSWRFTVHPTLPVLAMNWDHEGIRLWQ